MRSPEGGTAAAAAAHTGTPGKLTVTICRKEITEHTTVERYTSSASCLACHCEPCNHTWSASQEAGAHQRGAGTWTQTCTSPGWPGGRARGELPGGLAPAHIRQEQAGQAAVANLVRASHTLSAGLSNASKRAVPRSCCPPRLQLSSTEDFAIAAEAQNRAMLRTLPPRLLLSSSWRGLAPGPLPHLHDCCCDGLLCRCLVQHCGNVPVKQPVTRPLELTAGLLLRLVLPAACCTCCVCVCCWAVVGVYVPERLGHV